MEYWIIGLLVLGMMVLLALLFVERERRLNPDRRGAVLAVPDFEAKDRDEILDILSQCNSKDPVLCAVLSKLHLAIADCAQDCNDTDLPEWMTKKADGGLQYLMQFEAELKDDIAGLGLESDKDG